MEGSGGMSPRGKKKTYYVTCLTALRDVSQTSHSFLSESLGVNQSMIHLLNKQTKQTGRLRLYICQPNDLAKTKLQNWPTFPSRHKGLG